jgi:hypothetical protein
MHSYVHLMLRDTPEKYSQQELETLSAHVASAPSVKEVKKIERHARGGYSVQLDVHSIQTEALGAYLEDCGYSFVI